MGVSQTRGALAACWGRDPHPRRGARCQCGTDAHYPRTRSKAADVSHRDQQFGKHDEEFRAAHSDVGYLANTLGNRNRRRSELQKVMYVLTSRILSSGKMRQSRTTSRRISTIIALGRCINRFSTFLISKRARVSIQHRTLLMTASSLAFSRERITWFQCLTELLSTGVSNQSQPQRTSYFILSNPISRKIVSLLYIKDKPLRHGEHDYSGRELSGCSDARPQRLCATFEPACGYQITLFTAISPRMTCYHHYWIFSKRRALEITC